jgi:hypothetical protein
MTKDKIYDILVFDCYFVRDELINFLNTEY